jgi:hypothetical protein
MGRLSFRGSPTGENPEPWGRVGSGSPVSRHGSTPDGRERRDNAEAAADWIGDAHRIWVPRLSPSRHKRWPPQTTAAVLLCAFTDDPHITGGTGHRPNRVIETRVEGRTFLCDGSAYGRLCV